MRISIGTPLAFSAGALSLALSVSLPARALTPPRPAAAPSGPATGLFALQATAIDGTPQPLSAWQGKVLLVVNVASECYYTRQYPGLEKLYREYADRGFVVLGFPSNDFGGQEPGTDKQIHAFCTGEQHVSFPLFQKGKVTGDGASAVFSYLTQQAGPPKWNFHKYLVGRDGRVLGGYPSATAPEDKKLRAAIEEALAAPAGAPAPAPAPGAPAPALAPGKR